MTESPSVVVIGGGVTGAGIARDLAMRGIEVTLLERGGLAEGTTGRMHGLLHSGARYANADPESARQCIQENRILRSIAGHCIEDTGGLFVSLEMDEREYLRRKREACEDAEIPVEGISGSEARRREPALSPSVERALTVPDAAIDPFRLVAANVGSAETNGATIRHHHEVTDLVLDDGEVTGVEVVDGTGTEPRSRTITADHVVNATGPWADSIASMAGVDVPLSPSKGTMAVTNTRPVGTVINRARSKTEGDILVPHETTAILGTTDTPVDDPDATDPDSEAVAFLVEELAAMVPSLEDSRIIRAYAGVRPLYDPTRDGSETIGASRDFAVLDHESRDGLPGLTTVVGGKLTTYRLMAEEAVDLVAAKLGVEARCRTDEEQLPGSGEAPDVRTVMDRYGLRSPVALRTTRRLGDRTDDVLEGGADSATPTQVLCECEGVTRAEVMHVLSTSKGDLQAVRKRTRATMGTCQGGICAPRLAIEMFRATDRDTAGATLRDLLEERWRGQRAIVEDDQLVQTMENLLRWTNALAVRQLWQSAAGIPFDRFDQGGAGKP